MFLQQPLSDDHCARLVYSDMLALGDERVIQELQTGNADAFAVIFKRYHRLVHLTALHILRFFWRFIGKRDNLTRAEGRLKCGFCSMPIVVALIVGIT